MTDIPGLKKLSIYINLTNYTEHKNTFYSIKQRLRNRVKLIYCNKMIDKYEHSLIPITLSARMHRRHIGINTPKMIASVVESKECSLRKGCLQIKEKSII